MSRKLLLFFICLSLPLVTLYAQQLSYAVEFNHFLDNREYSNNYEPSQTMLGARLNTMLGAKLDSTQGFMAGINYLYEYGDRINGNTPTVNLFYHYQTTDWTFIFGSFPRRGLLNYPLALLSDTLDNYRPNIQGGYVEKRGNWGYENAWCDWLSRQQVDVRETFMAGLSGQVNFTPNLFLDHYFYMYHDALTANHPSDQYIRDNGAYGVLAGADFTQPSKFDLLTIRVGSLGCYNRFRPDPDLNFYFGFFSQLHAYYNRFGIDASYYRGDKLNVAYGDMMYMSGNYGRIDFAYIPLKTKYITSRIALCMHDVAGKWQSSQTMTLIFKVGEYYKTYHEWPMK